MNRAASVLLAGACLLPAAFADGVRPWTVEDSVAVRYFVTLQDQAPTLAVPPNTESPIVVSPGGRRFFFITQRGDLTRDCTHYELQVFDTESILRALRAPAGQAQRPPPVTNVGYCTALGGQIEGGISRAHWQSEDTVLLTGSQSLSRHATRGLYRLTVSSGKLHRLTDEAHDVETFVVHGDSLLYSTLERRERTDLDYPAFAMNGRMPLNLTRRHEPFRRLYAVDNGGTARALGGMKALAAMAVIRNRGLWMAPGGLFAIAQYAPADVPLPASWSAYRFGEGISRASTGATRFMLVDIQQGSVRPVFDAPVGAIADRTAQVAPEAFWSADGKQVVLVNTALPLTGEQQERRAASYIVVYDVATGKYESIERMSRPDGTRVASVSWHKPGRELLVTRKTARGEDLPGTIYAFNQGRRSGVLSARAVAASMQPPPAPGWYVKELPKLPGGLKVILRQGANEQPVLVASSGNRELALSDPDTALEGVAWTPLQPVSWTEEDGKVFTGSLLLPRKPLSNPPPLAIQIGHNVPGQFLPDGSTPTGFAAQALAARGIAVLNVDRVDQDRRETAFTLDELKWTVRRVNSAVDSLAQRGSIDRERVGLIGFSWTGYQVYYAITHPARTKIAASVIADSLTASFAEYLISNADSRGSDGNGQPEETMYGGGSFWRNKQSWLDHAPSFNVDRVQGAALFATNNIAGMVYAAEKLAAFRLNRRPIEYLIIVDGAHQLQRPRERFESLTATVDWMSFWLLGEENPAAERQERNARWRVMRKDWQQVQALEAAGHRVGERPGISQ